MFRDSCIIPERLQEDFDFTFKKEYTEFMKETGIRSNSGIKFSRRSMLGATLFAVGAAELGLTQMQDAKIQQQASKQAENMHIDTLNSPSIPDSYRDDQKKRNKAEIYSGLARKNYLGIKALLGGLLWAGAGAVLMSEKINSSSKKYATSLKLYQEPSSVKIPQE